MATDGVILPALANGEGTNLVQGEIVRQSTVTKNTILRALATSAAGVQGTLGIVLSGNIGPGGPVIVESAGRQRVLLETGLTPAVGQYVFVSALVAGRGTNAATPTNTTPLGTILDTSTYTRDSHVLVALPTVLTPAALLPPGGRLIASYKSGVVNLLAAPANYSIVMPLVAGLKFYGLNARVVMLTRDAPATTGLTYFVGQNGANLQNASSALSTAVINGIAASATYGNLPQALGARDMTTFVYQFGIGVAIIGPTDCTGYLELEGYYE